MVKRVLLCLLFVMPIAGVWAFDFSATMSNGTTLYFNVVEGGVEVTHPSDAEGYINAWQGYTKPTGALAIPATVSSGSDSYSVVAVGHHAFYGCDGITSVVLPEGVALVDAYAFNYCTSITQIYLPSTLTSIGNQGLGNLTSLADLWVDALTPPTTHQYTFYQTDLSTVMLHIKCVSASAYAEADRWGDFGQVDALDCTLTVNVVANCDECGTVSGGGDYLAGSEVTLLATPAEGYCFAYWSDVNNANPRTVTLVENLTLVAYFYPIQVDTVTDTVYLAVPVHDTMEVHDTVYFAVPTHDTVYYTDTQYVSVPVHDTVMLADTVYTTIVQHDTVVQHDTIFPTFFRLDVLSDNQQLGIGVGSALLPAGVEAEVCGLPLEGGRFLSWDDGVTDNPRKITVKGTQTLRALFEQVGVASAEAMGWSCSVVGRNLCVKGVDGHRVNLYDIQGRRLLSQTCLSEMLSIRVPAAGVYLLQVDDGAARRVTVN